jgi:hypothetical protein
MDGWNKDRDVPPPLSNRAPPPPPPPPPSSSPQRPESASVRPVAPGYSWLVVAFVAVLLGVCFVVSFLPHASNTGFGTACGSVLLPNFVSTGDSSDCQDALAGPRAVVFGCGIAAACGAALGARHSGSVGRLHTNAWTTFLVIGAAAAFLVIWAGLAWLVANSLVWEQS